ncbi:hypothetical protein VNO77_02305 [Canavalia gladiata]|uniref:Uncharacterized protein n=1 Tax=Canavalia gladiata TaxID=3824 RepID=A0AAN9R2X6_CANGL
MRYRYPPFCYVHYQKCGRKWPFDEAWERRQEDAIARGVSTSRTSHGQLRHHGLFAYLGYCESGNAYADYFSLVSYAPYHKLIVDINTYIETASGIAMDRGGLPGSFLSHSDEEDLQRGIRAAERTP